MIKFIKKLLFGTPANVDAEVNRIFTPTVVTPAPAVEYIPPAKPVNKVKAIGETGAQAVKAATAPKPANKKRRPYRGNKNAGGTVAKVNQPKPAVTEGKTKGGNNVVKLQQPAKKPQAPKSAKKK